MFLSKKITLSLISIALLAPSLSFGMNFKAKSSAAQSFKYGAGLGATYALVYTPLLFAGNPTLSLPAKVGLSLLTTAGEALIGGCILGSCGLAYDLITNKDYRNEKINTAKTGAIIGSALGVIPAAIQTITVPGTLSQKALNALKIIGAGALCGSANVVLNSVGSEILA